MSNDWERRETSRAHLHLETVCVSPPFQKDTEDLWSVQRRKKRVMKFKGLNRQFMYVFKYLPKSRKSPLAILVGLIWVFNQARVQMQFPPAQLLELFPAPRVIKHKSWCKRSRDDLLSLGKALSLFCTIGHGLIIKRRVIPHMFMFQLLANAVMCVSRTASSRAL